MKRRLSFLTLFGAVALFAEPSVTVDGVKMRYPFSRLVDIDYTVADLNNEAAGYVLEVSVTAETTGATNTWTASHFETYAPCDLPTSGGSHRITWDPSSEADFFANAVKVRLTLRPTGLTKATAGYLIVDVSGGPSAASYPVTYVPASIAPSEFNRRLYKTSKIVLKKCPGGTFLMGDDTVSSSGGVSCFPEHYVQVDAFWCGLFQLTDRQYLNVVGGKSPSDYTNAAKQGITDTDVCPVNGSGFQTKTLVYKASTGFLPLLTAKAVTPDGATLSFELPTEAQWEYVARAGGTIRAKYPWGADTTTVANDYVWSYANCATCLYPHEVGTLQPTGWGFYDLAGNVWEICRDFLAAYPSDTTEENPQVNPVGEGSKACIRGCTSFWRNLTPIANRYATMTNTVRDFGCRISCE